MGYLIGAGPLDPAVKRYNGGTSSFTMDNSGTTNGTLLWVDGVAQVPGTDYNVSGTTITTTTAAAAGTNTVVSLQLFNTGLITTPADNTVAIAKIQDDAVTLAKMAAGTDGNIISYDTSGNPVAVATGSDGQVLTSSGAGAVCAFEDASSGGFTLATEQATTSGTSVTFGSIPTGTKLILIMFEGMGFSAAVDILVTIGDSGGLETSGYISSGFVIDNGSPAVVNSTAAFIINYDSGARTTSGIMTLALKDSSNFTWISSHTTKNYTDNASFGGGDKSLSAELTQVSISGGTFDAGSINIMYQ
jgi:hypothetical protein